MEEEFYFDELHQADIDSGIVYYWYKYDRDQYHTYQNGYNYDDRESIRLMYFEKHSTNDECDTGIAGIIDMINYGVIRHPAYIAWERMRTMIDFTDTYRTHMDIDDWIKRVKEPQKRVEILEYLIKSADIIYNSYDRGAVKHLKAMLPKHKAAAQERQKELKRQAAEERAKNKQPKEKPEYTLSVDEIIQYVLNAGSHTASAISDMLRYFAFEKDGWKKDVIKKKLLLLDTPVVVQGDLVQGNKNEANFQVPVGQVNQNVEHMNTNKE